MVGEIPTSVQKDRCSSSAQGAGTKSETGQKDQNVRLARLHSEVGIKDVF